MSGDEGTRGRRLLEKLRGRGPAEPQPRAEPPKTSLIERVQTRLQSGATIEAIARLEHISLPLAQIMVEELTRSGQAIGAESLCASGLGLCGGGTDEAARLYCAGCPLIPLKLGAKDPAGVTQ